ncbi:glycosyltransferase family 4 protein [Oleiharenicola sp. Vm1]|uniref:glycosyltransferase family 4 protein n=1 Tax=Oleiharenicola sp. Vm1 TaxID=3398393 RepID=UPI0039F4BD1D
MVETAVRGLPEHGIELCHVNLRLSRSHADIGGWRPGKLLAVLDACGHALAARFTARCDTLYYVPAPAKRGALYRDWLVLALCRPFFPRLVLHFHNGGLGEWLRAGLTAPERALTQRLLGGADLALVLTPALRADADALGARRVAVVPNGLAAPAPASGPARDPGLVLFLGQVSAAKGALDLLAAVRRLRADGRDVRVVFAGAADADVAAALAAARAEDPDCGELAGFVGPAAKAALLARCACLALPTRYAHEAQPLVLLEAFAADRPVVATRWRGIADTVPDPAALVAPGDVTALAAALRRTLDAPPPTGEMRRWFESRFTRERHLAALADALRSV